MDNLIQLYQEREVLVKYNASTDEIDRKIAQIQDKVLNDSACNIIGYLPEKVEAPIGSHIVVAAEYESGCLVKTTAAFNILLEDKFDNITKISDDESEDEEQTEEYELKRKKSVGFTVYFSDNKIIHQNTAIQTMIEALRYMGLERASQFTDETFKGYPFIGKKRRPGGRWQKNVDGWWVYINMSNERKISCLQGISKMLNIPLEIISDEDENQVKQGKQLKHKGRRAMFSLNGSTPMVKNRSVWETVRRFLEEMPDATFDDIIDQFPAKLQGSYGVVRKISEINERIRRNRTEDKRWFLDSNDILTAADGVNFAVSNEWGDNFANFQTHIQNELGWSLDES